ncbi:hypothetical protein BLI708_06660 [Bifidobacterium imperatoris]|uniref:Uncharacterized protein n=1 Tax=Bifidobacterium imperatoris TaxID=2020965 RepID=A0A2N5IQV6_9BIFI|nr:hypothetical protein [Bifidobacterium imperatoris]PLS24344.1 hypothetical protein Tam1G_1607 [Bifidobacterium imperatoris]QSY56954.1 hypothetical protein BLI708_06660 [Bifidobacterium imperatoris]
MTPSRNLTAYGPATANGFTAKVNADKSLSLTGDEGLTPGAGLAWPTPAVSQPGQYSLSVQEKLPANIYAGVWSGTLTPGEDRIAYMAAGKTAVTFSLSQEQIDKGIKCGFCRYLNDSNDSFGPIDVRLQLEQGSTPTEWTPPDDTNASGGGISAMNLWPTLKSTSAYGVKCERDGEAYMLNGTPSQWGGIYKDIVLAAGDYVLSMQGTGVYPTPRLQYPPSNPDTIYNAPASFTLTEPTSVRCQLTLNPTETYAGSVTPQLYKI